MSCLTRRWREVTRDLPLLFLHVFLMILSLTQAEEFNNGKITLARSIKQPTMSMCLRQLESRTPLKIRAKLLVRPIGPGSNTVHIAGSVDFPTEELEIRGEWAPLHYEYTSFNKRTVYLNVTLKGKSVTYNASRTMFFLRYNLEVVKIYVQGRVEIIDTEDCSHLETPSTAAVLSNPAALYTIKTDSGDTMSWVWVMGAAGTVPILIILVVLLISMVLVVASFTVFLWRRRKAANTTTSKNKDAFAACRDPFMLKPQTTDTSSSTSSSTATSSSSYPLL